METLTFKQQKFCNEYLVSFNAYRSAILAGYSVNSARKAELLHIPKIQEYLKKVMAQSSERAQITHARILREYEKIAFSSMGDYFDYKGIGKQIVEMTADERAALSYYEIVNVVDKDNVLVGEKVKIKLHNKMAALDKIARHTDFYNAKANRPITLPPDADTGDTEEDLAFEEKYNSGKAEQAYRLSHEVAVELHNNWGSIQPDFEMVAEEEALTGEKGAKVKPEALNLAVQYDDEGACYEAVRVLGGMPATIKSGMIAEERGRQTVEKLLVISH